MNNMYGTTIIRPVETDTTIKDNKMILKNVSLNYNYIDSVL